MNDSTLLWELISERAQTATVCTEPATIAFAVASAAAMLDTEQPAVAVVTCPGVFKNALGAGLPGTDRRGPAMAAALGAVVGRPESGLAILQAVNCEQVRRASLLVDEARVTASVDPTRDGLYVRAVAQAGGHTAAVTVAGCHSQLTEATLDGHSVDRRTREAHLAESELADRCFAPVAPPATDLALLRGWSFQRLVAAALDLDPATIMHLHSGAIANLALGTAALGHSDGKAELDGSAAGYIPSPTGVVADSASQSLDWRVRTLVAAAVGARMSGRDWPVLTSSGSGNQGITIAIPVLLLAEALGTDPQRQVQALALAHAVNLCVHAYVGEVSPSCGATSAAAAVAVATCWLLGGDLVQMEAAAQLTLASFFGMICDGAKGSCALKCGAGAVEGLLCGQWARSGVQVRLDTGITGRSLPETLALAQSIVEGALRQIDDLIIAARMASQ